MKHTEVSSRKQHSRRTHSAPVLIVSVFFLKIKGTFRFLIYQKCTYNSQLFSTFAKQQTKNNPTVTVYLRIGMDAMLWPNKYMTLLSIMQPHTTGSICLRSTQLHILYKQLGCLAFSLTFWPKISSFQAHLPKFR